MKSPLSSFNESPVRTLDFNSLAFSSSARIAIAAALLLAAFAASLRAEASKPDDRFRKANAAYTSGEFAEAVGELRELVNEGKFSGGALHNLGNAEWKVGCPAMRCWRGNARAR